MPALILVSAALLLQAGVPPVSSEAVRPIGVITSIDAAAGPITIKTDAGPEMRVSVESGTKFLQVSPGAKDLASAAPIAMADLALGDRILARGRSAPEAGSLVASTIIVMSKADIARKRAAERAEWERRGAGGIITALNAASREITIRVPTATGTRTMVIALAPGAVLRRYAPNSVKFSDARLSRFEELQAGDQVKALGTSNEDKSRLTAEELVSGSFRNIAATVVALDRERNTIQIADLATKKRMEAQVTSDSTLRKLSAPVAQMLALRVSAERTPAGPSPGGESPPQQSPRDVQSVIEKLPAFSLADLKPGDAVILSCTNSDDTSRITAITLLAGVEPMLQAASRGGRALDIGAWNLDLNMNVGGP